MPIFGIQITVAVYECSQPDRKCVKRERGGDILFLITFENVSVTSVLNNIRDINITRNSSDRIRERDREREKVQKLRTNFRIFELINNLICLLIVEYKSIRDNARRNLKSTGNIIRENFYTSKIQYLEREVSTSVNECETHP